MLVQLDKSWVWWVESVFTWVFSFDLTLKRDMSKSFESSIVQVKAKNPAFQNRHCHTQRHPCYQAREQGL